MKRLTLVRHAKSDWGDPKLGDHDRPLNARGLQVAPAVGDALVARGCQPDLILTSTAVRARTTAEIIAEKLGYPAADIQREDIIYLAPVSALEQVVKSIDDTAGIERAMVFGHNPGMEDFLDHLIGGGSSSRFVTCAVAELELEIGYWGEVGTGCGKLLNFLTPHDL